MRPVVKIMKMLPATRIGHMNVLEKFIMYFEKTNNEINDKVLFQVIY